MKEHKEMLERYHRSAFIFEIKKETVANYGLKFYLVMLIVFGYIAYNLFKIALDKDE